MSNDTNINPDTIKVGDIVVARPSRYDSGGVYRGLIEGAAHIVVDVRPRGTEGATLDVEPGNLKSFGYEWFDLASEEEAEPVLLKWSQYPKGTTATIRGDQSGHAFSIGNRVKCIGHDGFGDSRWALVDGGDGDYWFVAEIELGDIEEPVAEKSGRPLIDFSTERKSTARQYAADLMHASLSLEHNHLLRKVVSGEKVDAYAFNAAILAAMRSCSNRGRTSADRKRLAEKTAHLGYIVQATLENHADGLPAYAEGERSRKLKAQKELLDEAGKALREAQETVERVVGEREEAERRVNTLERERAETLEDLGIARVTVEQIAGSATGTLVREWIIGYVSGRYDAIDRVDEWIQTLKNLR